MNSGSQKNAVMNRVPSSTSPTKTNHSKLMADDQASNDKSRNPNGKVTTAEDNMRPNSSQNQLQAQARLM